MADRFKILYKGGESELVVKKSRFIATLRPVESEEEAAAFLAEMRKKYWDASHNCFAFTIGMNHELTRCSDDGEPAQTAGRPMLEVLLGEDVHNVCAVVTRYFGGTLLGTGGLVRAYSGAVKEGLAASAVVEKQRAFRMLVHTDYSSVGKIQYILGQEKITVLSSDYTDKVDFALLVPASQCDPLKEALTEGTNGTAGIELGDEVWFGLYNKEVVLFE
ncbi:MAG TPA: YigZ family protein [Candidatus Copromonas faecavium]|uniref:YigZ family protein n=1 Tax=Candidatus Copromonas faecavium (nom. illeg.) TaxID=2840740 RepID=A0A9D1A5N4_9FIRM|nr:YigZ family protein [Candidatus Copromonas faecavium]